MSNFALLSTEYGDENNVQIPRGARICKGNHKYDPTIVANKAVGYIPVQYEHQAYPRMLFHPDFGLAQKPDIARFAAGAHTPEQYQSAQMAYQDAESAWARKNRTKLVHGEKEEAKLTKKGWLLKPPARELAVSFDMESDEL